MKEISMSTKEILGVLVILFSIALTIWGIRYVSGVLTPLLISFVIAITLRPVFNFLKFYAEKIIKHFFKEYKCKFFALDVFYFSVTMLIPAVVIFFIYKGFQSTFSNQLSIVSTEIISKSEVVGNLFTSYLSQQGVGSDELKNLLKAINLPEPSEEITKSDTAQNIKAVIEKNADAVEAAKEALIKVMPALLSTLGGTFIGGMGAVGKSLFSLVVALATWIVLPQFIFYMMSTKLKKENIESSTAFLLPEGSPFNSVFSEKLIQFRDVLESYFQKQSIAVVVYFFVYWGALSSGMVGSNYSFELAVIFALLNFFPNFGTISFILFSAIMYVFGEHTTTTLSTTAFLWGIIISAYYFDELVITKIPFFKDLIDHKVHSGEMIFFILFWGAVLNGLLGMLLAVPLAIFFKMVRENKEGIAGYLYSKSNEGA